MGKFRAQDTLLPMPENGESAVSYWIVTNVSQVHRDKQGLCTPPVVTATALMKVGEESATTPTNATLWRQTVSQTNTTSAYSKYTVAIPVATLSSINFELREGDTLSGTLLASTTVSVVDDGVDGNAITGVLNYYLISDNGETVPSYDEPWIPEFDSEGNQQVPVMTETEPYLWNYEKILMTTGISRTAPRVIGRLGSDGRGIVSVTEYYLASSHYSGITAHTTGWVTSPSHANATMSDEKPYLWNYERITYNKADSVGNTYTNSTPTIIGVKGKDGTSITIKDFFLKLFATKVAFNASDDKNIDGTYLITKNESANSYHWVAKVNGSNITYTQAALGDGYVKNDDGHLYTAVESGWHDVGQFRGEQGLPGDNGKDAVTISVTPASILVKKNVIGSSQISVSVKVGGEDVLYSTENEANTFTISQQVGGTSQGSWIVTNGVAYSMLSHSSDRKTLNINLTYTGLVDVNKSIDFNVIYRRTATATETYPQKISMRSVADGDKGDDAVAVDIISDVDIFKYERFRNMIIPQQINWNVKYTKGNTTEILDTYQSIAAKGYTPHGKLHYSNGDPLILSNGELMCFETNQPNPETNLLPNKAELWITNSSNQTIASKVITRISNGATIRGPKVWASNTNYMSGAEDEAYIDIVSFNSKLYVCLRSHTSYGGLTPANSVSSNNGYWREATEFEFIATGLLLADYAIIDKLGVSYVEMRDDNDNILFQIKDGDVVCKTGEFEDVVVNNATLSSINVYTGSFENISVTDGFLTHINVEDGNFEGITVVDGNFQNITVKEGVFEDIAVTDGVFEDIAVENATLTNVTVQNGIFNDTTANRGTFNEINVNDAHLTDCSVSGGIQANVLVLGVEEPSRGGNPIDEDDNFAPEILTKALVTTNGGHYCLPQLPLNTSLVIEILVWSVDGDGGTTDLKLQGVNEDVIVCTGGNPRDKGRSGAQGYLDFGKSPGLYRCVGAGISTSTPDHPSIYGQITLWNVIRLDDATEAIGRNPMVNGGHGQIPSGNNPPGVFNWLDHISGDIRN